VKCHSKRFDSRGSAWKSALGVDVISAASRTDHVVSTYVRGTSRLDIYVLMRLIVGDLRAMPCSAIAM
jgi:hypothetical protein